MLVIILRYCGVKTGWNYKSQSELASESQQCGFSQISGGAAAESKGTAVVKRES